MTLHIKLLGNLHVEEEKGAAAPLLKSQKGCALLTYLIVTGEPQRRELLADLLWDVSSTYQSLRNLRTMLTRIRRWTPGLTITRQQVGFAAETAVFIDYLTLNHALNTGSIADMDAALMLYQGELLADFYLEDAPRFNEWLLWEREQLRQRVTAAYHQICFAYSEQEAWVKGIATAQRWLTTDEFDEEALRHLLQFLAASGQVGVALQQYETSRQRLWEEMGVEPTVETVQLAQRLKGLKQEQGSGLAWSAIVGAQLERPFPGQLAEPGNLPNNAYLPYRRNHDFTGRHQSLQRLAQWLLPAEEGSETCAVAVTGMGGLGKTQLAVEFCYRYGRFYAGGIYWISFAQAENVAEEIAAIGGERGMQLYTEAEKLTIADQVGRVQRAWQEPTPRLLIFDNCEAETLLAQWRPVSGGCRVLLTSRHSQWTRDLGVTTYPLTTLARSESIRLLQRMTPHLSAEESHALDQIAANLGDLPLALQLAGSFLHRYQRITPSRYLAQLEQLGSLQHPSLQGHGSSHSPTAHERNLARTFAFSLEQLDPANEIDAAARQLLARAACFAPGEPIPSSLLMATLQEAEAEEPDLLAELLAEDGLARLLSLGFLRQAEPETVVMHQLLARFTQLYLAIEGAKTAVCQTIVALCSRSLEATGATYTLPIALTQVRHLIHTASEKDTALIAQLALFLGEYLHRMADFAASQKYLEQTLALSQQVYGRYHTQVARCLNSLAALHTRSGKYQAAGAAFQEALAVYEAIYEPEHPHMRILLSNIGYLLTLQGSYQQAKPYLERALPPQTEVNGNQSVSNASKYNNLGIALLHLGELAAAQVYLERGLNLRQSTLAPDHPYIAVSLQNMGLLAIRQGNFAVAQNYLEMALSIREKAVGHKHPHMARSLNALGELFLAQADYETARAYFEQALAIQAEVFIAQHPEKAAPLKNLGEVYWAMGQREQARPFFEQARDILLKTAVSTHPDLSSIQQKLAAL